MTLNNPLNFPSITDLLAAVLNVVIVISTPIVIFFLIYAGFSFVTAQGNPEKLTQAKKSVMYGIIGGVLIMGSVAIITIINSTVNAF